MNEPPPTFRGIWYRGPFEHNMKKTALIPTLALLTLLGVAVFFSGCQTRVRPNDATGLSQR